MFTSFIWAMENLKRRRMKASILLEALVAMAVFAAIASLLLGQISQSRQEQTRLLQEEEVLRVARMAMQTGQESLTVNGITVRQVKTDRQLTDYHQQEKVLSVKKRLNQSFYTFRKASCPAGFEWWDVSFSVYD